MSGSVDSAPLPSSPHISEPQPRQTWWARRALGRQFWIFFAAAFFFDFGFGLYFFLFNLFLLNLHFDERAIGLIASSLTLGNIAGTIPVGILARRLGLQKVLLFCFIAAPIVAVFRTAIPWMPMQIAMAFLMGLTMSSWPVCFAPAIAGLTTEDNRAFAFSISFATGIGTGSLSGLIGGWLPGLLNSSHHSVSISSGMRLVLIGAAAVAMLGVFPILRLSLGRPDPAARQKLLVFHPYLRRFLPVFAVWSIVTGSFIPFAPIFFEKQFGVSLQNVGLIFSASQLAQFCAVLVAPMFGRKAGSVYTIVCAQLLASFAVFSLRLSHTTPLAVAGYLAFTAVQFTASPGFYALLMSRVPEADRSSASAAQNIVGALSQAGSAALTGILIVRSGYPLVLSLNAILALLSAILVLSALSSDQPAPNMSNACRTEPAS